MRIIAGSARGRAIEAPRGERTRPTTDRVRESLMSSVASWTGGIEGACVCDAFAGSGALGLEAISRGAALAVLCDADKEALRVIRANVAALGFEEQARILGCDVLARGLPAAPEPYAVVFLDPPYATDSEELGRMLGKARSAGMLAEGCLVCYEHDARVDDEGIDALARCAELDRIRTKRYGKAILDYLSA